MADQTKKIIPVDELFSDFMATLIFDVVHGVPIATAKHRLHTWVDNLSDADKILLSQKITALSRRVRDVADTLTSETPSLIAKMQ